MTSPPAASARTARECPKHMTYGPCGGVRPTGQCEVAEHQCAFVDAPLVTWRGSDQPFGQGGARRPPTETAGEGTCQAEAAGTPGAASASAPSSGAPSSGGEPKTWRPAPSAAGWVGPATATVPTDDGGPPPLHPAARARLRMLEARPVVVSDFPSKAPHAPTQLAVARVLAGAVDAVVAGEPPSVHHTFPPAYRAAMLRETGLDVWPGVNTRDRNRVALEAEVAALAHVGVGAVHCVTGDHTAKTARPDAMPVFDLDALQLVALARQAGHLISVAANPASPPTSLRAARLVEKQRAGAHVAVVNLVPEPDDVGSFIARARALGFTGHVIACVPVVIDAASARVLAGLGRDCLDPELVPGVLGAPDPWSEGVARAVAAAEAMLAVPGVGGVCLSGAPGREDSTPIAEAFATVATRLALR